MPASFFGCGLACTSTIQCAGVFYAEWTDSSHWSVTKINARLCRCVGLYDGEGLEQGWLSPYLIGKGLTIQESALLFSVYGFAAAISAWFSGVLAEIFTARRVMLAGLLLFLLGSVCFLVWGLPSNNLSVMIPTYALRGLGYPLFAYGFLVWVAYEAPPERLGSAVGIFWFVYSGGLSVLGVLYSSIMLPFLGKFTPYGAH